MKPIITPTIFVNSVVVLKERLDLYEEIATRVQLDIADESFTAQPTLGVEKMLGQATTLERDVHLMTLEPIDWLEICSQEGVKTAIGQIENMSSQGEFLKEGRELGLKIGLAIDLETDLIELDWLVAKKVDLILVMAVRAGQEAQKFNQEALKRVKLLRAKGYSGEVCVDGGVNETTINSCVKAGTDILAIGSALWQARDVKMQFQKLTKLAEVAYEI
jgi:ribulose-phosphate 3-epimerase